MSGRPDRFPVTITGAKLQVDTGLVVQGPPIGTNTTGQDAEGRIASGRGVDDSPGAGHARPVATLSTVVMKALVVAVIVLLIVVGIALLAVGMGHGHCLTCDPAASVMSICMAVLAAAISAIALASERTRLRRMRALELLRAAFFDRPPQLTALA